MTRVMEELSAASGLLRSTLERYLSACTAVENCATPRALLDRVIDELSLVSSYATKVEHAKASLSRTRNRSSIISIHTLPSEILARVFELVLDTHSCNGDVIAQAQTFWDRDGIQIPKYPDLLSHVCSRWRQVVTTSPNLWTHIDLIPHCRFSKNLLARAETSMARARQIPLDIHIIDTAPRFPADVDLDGELFQFLSTVTHINSLSLVTERPFQDFHSVILESCFAGPIPGTLTQLSMSERIHGHSPSFTFLETAENSQSTDSMLLALSEQLLEDLWRSITALRLHGLYPYWTSQAYHGLVELRITSDGRTPRITEPQLVRILTASPQLRILHLKVEFDPPPAHGPAVRVRLVDLEVLNLQSIGQQGLETVLRLLAPGEKPLRLSLNLKFSPSFVDSSLYGEIKLFFARSNVTNLHVEGMRVGLSLAEIRDISPHLQVLALQNFNFLYTLVLESNSNQSQGSATLPYLNCLYMLDFLMDLDYLRCMLERYPVHTVTIWNGGVHHAGKTIYEEQELKNHLPDNFPVVRMHSGGENPIKDWELHD